MEAQPGAVEPGGVRPPGLSGWRTPLLICGMPCSGKSFFARHLARQHGAAHYELAAPWHRWPEPASRELWLQSRAQFVDFLRRRHSRVVLDWTCPSDMLDWLGELAHAGVQSVWFDANVYAARRLAQQRGDRIGVFDSRVRSYLRADPAARWQMQRIDALSVEGEFMAAPALIARIFG